MRLLITGGAGFIGSSLARMFNADGAQVIVFDNLRRRGSEYNLIDFHNSGIKFIHGDVRNFSDVESVPGNFDLVIDAAAEPSVLAGSNARGIRYLYETNLNGTLNCLEFVRTRKSKFIFLSTSRVYAINALKKIKLREENSRFQMIQTPSFPGLTSEGINENFPVVGQGLRSLYGSTKLASELFVEEYAENFNIPAVINRCGVIAGPGQFGQVDQGVFAMWVARHLWSKPLQYKGFDGKGKQVRDLLHPRDLYELLKLQIRVLDDLRGEVFVASGGQKNSVSLCEFTAMCRTVTGNSPEISVDLETAVTDVPFFIGDSGKARKAFGWSPEILPEAIVQDIAKWLRIEEKNLISIF